MEKEAGIDDRKIFLAQRFGQGILKLLLGVIILVAEETRSNGRHENFFRAESIERIP